MTKTRFLVLHDYGMGGVWWWIHARSATEVVETFADVEVVDDPAAVERAGSWEIDEVDVDSPDMPSGLDDMRARRDAMRALPGFGALVGKDVVHLRRVWDEEDVPVVYLMEVGPDGRRLRQVEVPEGGTAVRSDPDDWAFNPPVVDLYDPKWVECEIGREEFEEAWAGAVPLEPST
ncbi:hypothetical protein [Umezawaea sp. NPDC059074]|uniref:hypothetical protein n=1 Tax=Umezawaea sp. NPDC059074 TaxID=3346716 RepID=UPI0036CCC2F2